MMYRQKEISYSGTFLYRTPLGTNILSVIARCPNSGASGIFPVGMVLRNPVVEYYVAAFSELFFATRWQGRLSRGWY